MSETRTVNTAEGKAVERPTLHATKSTAPSATVLDEVEQRRAELKKQLRELEEKHGTTPEDPETPRPFLVDLAPSSSYIDYNGVRYYHGQTYPVDYYLYCSLAEIQGNTWKHEKTLHESENQYRRPLKRVVR